MASSEVQVYNVLPEMCIQPNVDEICRLLGLEKQKVKTFAKLEDGPLTLSISFTEPVCVRQNTIRFQGRHLFAMPEIVQSTVIALSKVWTDKLGEHMIHSLLEPGLKSKTINERTFLEGDTHAISTSVRRIEDAVLVHLLGSTSLDSNGAGASTGASRSHVDDVKLKSEIQNKKVCIASGKDVVVPSHSASCGAASGTTTDKTPADMSPAENHKRAATKDTSIDRADKIRKWDFTVEKHIWEFAKFSHPDLHLDVKLNSEDSAHDKGIVELAGEDAVVEEVKKLFEKCRSSVFVKTISLPEYFMGHDGQIEKLIDEIRTEKKVLVQFDGDHSIVLTGAQQDIEELHNLLTKRLDAVSSGMLASVPTSSGREGIQSIERVFTETISSPATPNSQQNLQCKKTPNNELDSQEAQKNAVGFQNQPISRPYHHAKSLDGVSGTSRTLDEFVWEFIKFHRPSSVANIRVQMSSTSESDSSKVTLSGDFKKLDECLELGTAEVVSMKLHVPKCCTVGAVQEIVKTELANKVLVRSSDGSTDVEVIGQTSDVIRLIPSLEKRFPGIKMADSKQRLKQETALIAGVSPFSENRAATEIDLPPPTSGNGQPQAPARKNSSRNDVNEDARGPEYSAASMSGSAEATVGTTEASGAIGRACGASMTTYVMDEKLWAFIKFSETGLLWNSRCSESRHPDNSSLVVVTGNDSDIKNLKELYDGRRIHRAVKSKMQPVPKGYTAMAWKTLLEDLSKHTIFVRPTKDPLYCEMIGKQSDIAEVVRSIATRFPDTLSESNDQEKDNNYDKSSDIVNGISTSIPVHLNSVKNWQISAENKTLEFLTPKSEIRVIVVTGDILEQDCEVIVSPGNAMLDNIGGLSGKIAKEAGWELTSDCKTFIRQNHELKVSQVTDTRSGMLKKPVRRVIHACGPHVAACSSMDECIDILSTTFLNCFRHANFKLKAGSIALPAISSGLSGVPLDAVSRSAFQALMSFDSDLQTGTHRHLQRIKFVHFSDDGMACMVEIFQELSLTLGAPSHANGSAPDRSTAQIEVKISHHAPMSRLKRVADSNGLTAVEVHGRGDSALLAIADQLQVQHVINIDISKLRQEALAFLEEHQSLIDRSTLNRSYGGDVQLFLRRQKADDTPLEPAVLRGVAEVLGREIKIIHFDGNVSEFTPSETRGTALIIGAEFEDHYVSLRPKFDIEAVSSVDASRVVGAQHQKLAADRSDYVCMQKSAVPSTQNDPKETADHVSYMKSSDSNASCCAICMDDIDKPKRLECGHVFCTDCIDQSFQYQKKCPCCGKIFGALKGDQPKGGYMNVKRERRDLNGYRGCGQIVINYYIPDGIQQANHPNPGKPYKGAFRTAYLPNNDEGREICSLLERAFNAGLIFTVGRSTTSGRENVVTWNDIHHKTKPTGEFGYPDPGYLARVRDELAAKGITSSTACSAEASGMTAGTTGRTSPVPRSPTATPSSPTRAPRYVPMRSTSVVNHASSFRSESHAGSDVEDGISRSSSGHDDSGSSVDSAVPSLTSHPPLNGHNARRRPAIRRLVSLPSPSLQDEHDYNTNVPSAPPATSSSPVKVDSSSTSHFTSKQLLQ